MPNVLEIKVSKAQHEFHLSFPERWQTMYGHLLKIEDIEFSIIPSVKDGALMVRVSELHSGFKVIDLPFPEKISDKEATLEYFATFVGIQVYQAIQKYGIEKFKKAVDENIKKNTERIGPKPEGREVELDFETRSVNPVESKG